MTDSPDGTAAQADATGEAATLGEGRTSGEATPGEAEAPGRSADTGATETPGLEVRRLENWLRHEHPALTSASPLSATLLTGGKSNVTYGIAGGAVPMVLRRPPLGHVQETAHDMAREFRVISALAGTAVPVPEALALHDDLDGSAGTGSPFFLMTRMPGRALSTPDQSAEHTPAELRAISLELATLLADLHRIDPAAIGLEGFGRPDGYLGRQVHRWGLQYDGSRSRDLPLLDRLQERLREHVPATLRSGLVHGDFRLDNALVTHPRGDHAPTRDHATSAADPGPAQPRISAILDWEMSTLGDIGVDVGLLWLYWDLHALTPNGAVTAVDPAAGYPPFEELLDTYAAALGASVPDLAWYRAFAAYKLAVILEGVHFRHLAGDTVGDGFDEIGSLAEPLAADGLDHLSRVAAPRPASARPAVTRPVAT